MRRSIGDVVARLRAEGLAPPGIEDVARNEMAKEFADHLPSYLRAAVATGAFIATGFLMTFVLVLADLRSAGARLFVGALFMVFGAAMPRVGRGEFLRWAAVAMALAGGGLVTAAIGEMSEDATTTSLACLVSAVLLIYFVRDDVLRFLATLAGGASLLIAIESTRVGQGLDLGLVVIIAAAAWVWRVDLGKRSDAAAELLEPVGYGLLIVLFGGLIARTVLWSHGRLGAAIGPEVREIGQLGPLAGIALTLGLVALVWRVLEDIDVSLSSPTGIAALLGAAALGVGALNSPGIIAAVAVLMLGFDRRNVQLGGLAGGFLVLFLSLYYYNLELTLLQKSGVLIGSGALLIGIRQRIARSA